LKKWFKYATGNLKGEGLFAGGEEWMQKVLPEENEELRRRHRKWASVVLFGHLALAALFIATGQWILILLVNLPAFYCGWLTTLCGAPQHIGMMPNAPDFRLCCRTYTCNPFVGFLYWNMQYHVEHHMFPAVPFYNLPALRKAIAHDLPPAPHGLWATWREIIPVLKKQRENPDYVFIPELPNAA
jgi:fatty acid desaturase